MHRQLGVLATIIVAAASCATTEPPKKIDVPPLARVATTGTEPPAPPPPSSASTADAGPTPPLAAVPRPQAIACKLRTPQWDALPSLAFAPGTEPYVDLTSGAKVDVHVGNHVVFVSAQMGSLLIEGSLVGTLDLHPGFAFQATSYLAVLPAMEMTLAGPGKDTEELRVQLHAPPGVTPVNAADLVIERPCDHFRLNVVKFDPKDAFGSPKGLRKLSAGPRQAALLDAPSGKKLADLTADKDSPPSVLEEKGGHSLVIWPIGTAVLKGWVKASELRPLAMGVAVGVGAGGGGRGTKMANSSRKRRCSSDIPLIVKRGDERWIVGRIKSGTVMHLFDGPDDAFTPVDVNQDGVWLKGGAKFEVRDDDIKECARE